MSPSLLDSPQVRNRQAELRRRENRQAFFQQPASSDLLPHPLPAAESLRQSPCQQRSACPAAESPAAPPAATPAAEAADPPLPPEDAPATAASPESNPSAADSEADEARSLLADPRVQDRQRGKCPSRRNRDVYRAVVVANRQQRDVAAEFGISQPRVAQILKQVGSWLTRVVVDRDRSLPPEGQIQLAENVTRMQYEHLYAKALDLLQASEQRRETTVEKWDKDGELIGSHSTTAPPRPTAAFLHAALRAVGDRARFEGIVGLPAQRAEEAREQFAEDDESEDSASLTSGSYNPLSDFEDGDEDDAPQPEDLTSKYREQYDQYPGRFHGDLQDRGDYYRSQAIPHFGYEASFGDEEENIAGWIPWMHEFDLLGAEADQRAAQFAANQTGTPWTPEKMILLRRQFLNEAVQKWQNVCQSDAEGLIRDAGCDDETGRCVWDRKFEALVSAGSTPAA